MLGSIWLMEVPLDRRDVHHIKTDEVGTLQHMLERYKDVINELGKLKFMLIPMLHFDSRAKVSFLYNESRSGRLLRRIIIDVVK